MKKFIVASRELDPSGGFRDCELVITVKENLIVAVEEIERGYLYGVPGPGPDKE